MIADTAGRSFKKLRVSLTHQCNYACVYCVDDGKKEQTVKIPETIELGTKDKIIPSVELIEIIQKLHSQLNLEGVRLTGGEPMLHPRIRSIVTAIRDMGIKNIGMTTNGHFLHGRAKELFDAGLKSVNISLDAISPEIFEQMSLRQGLINVLKAIDASLNAGLNVKLNTVVVAGKNHLEIVPLLKFAIDKGIVIRFLELMPMGPLHNNRHQLFFPRSKMLDLIGSQYAIEEISRERGSTSDYWNIDGKKAFGIIANDSSPFCSDCNRLRLDSYGNLYGCLSSLVPIPVTAAIQAEELTSALQLAITHKQPSHFTGNLRTMQSIGG